MSRIAVGRRELGSLSREKTIVLALLIQVLIAAFSSFLVVGLTSLYEPGAAEDDVRGRRHRLRGRDARRGRPGGRGARAATVRQLQ